MAGPGGALQAALLAGAALLSASITAAWIALARRRNVMDAPGQRRLHDIPTPRGGGIGMAAVILTAALAGVQAGVAPPAIAWGLGLAAAIGLMDDLLPVRSWMKLLWQVASALAIAWVLPFPGLAPAAGVAASMLCTLVLLNFWNFMDGSNGLVAVQTMVVAAAFAWLSGSPFITTLAAVAVAACAGFLPFNLPRARVFMGDTGSHVLGATVAVLVLTSLRRGDAGPGQVAVLLSAFLVDAGLTLAKRIAQGRRFWEAHREHLYQVAVRRGHSHLRVCLAYAAWAILCAWLALGWGARGAVEGATAAIAVGTAGAATWFALRRHWLKRDKRMEAST
jgi:UDP-N-acetylmuramyl pentapeptide phosphotransferase/UDP-N-acetylglucosamine-1-phosphate transferase